MPTNTPVPAKDTVQVPATDQASFRERALGRLQAERGTPPAEPAQRRSTEARNTEGTPAHSDALLQPKGRDNAQLDPEDGAEVPDQDERQLSAPDSTAPEGADAEGDGTGDDGTPNEPEVGSAEYWQQRAEQAEDARQKMERDYRLKTHRQAALRRELQEKITSVESQVTYLAGTAERSVKQFENVQWELLKAQDPARYAQTRSAFEQAVRARDQLVGTFKALQERHSTMVEDAKSKEADLSREILTSLVPNWGRDTYVALREFASKELAIYDGVELDEITDWRTIWLLSEVARLRGGPRTPAQMREQRLKTPRPGPSRKPVAVPRNEQGQFQSARDRFYENPGDRKSFREMKLAQLQAERKQGRR